jgi:hypothetical protein
LRLAWSQRIMHRIKKISFYRTYYQTSFQDNEFRTQGFGRMRWNGDRYFYRFCLNQWFYKNIFLKKRSILRMIFGRGRIKRKNNRIISNFVKYYYFTKFNTHCMKSYILSPSIFKNYYFKFLMDHLYCGNYNIYNYSSYSKKFIGSYASDTNNAQLLKFFYFPINTFRFISHSRVFFKLSKKQKYMSNMNNMRSLLDYKKIYSQIYVLYIKSIKFVREAWNLFEEANFAFYNMRLWLYDIIDIILFNKNNINNLKSFCLTYKNWKRRFINALNSYIKRIIFFKRLNRNLQNNYYLNIKLFKQFKHLAFLKRTKWWMLRQIHKKWIIKITRDIEYRLNRINYKKNINK